MISLSNKTRLLAGAALGCGMLMAAAPAAAQCTFTATNVPFDTRTCASTVTTDTTGAGPTDRNFQYSVGLPTFLTIPTGANVTGYGLAWTTLSGGNTFPTTITNNGSVQIDSGNTATQGGASALSIGSNGATPVIYTGSGSITNLSTTGRGLLIESGVLGTAALTATVGGNVTNSSTGTEAAVAVISNGTAGNVRLESLTGTTMRSPFEGLFGAISNAASAANVTVINGGSVLSPTGAPNTIDIGIRGWSAATLGGTVTVTNNGNIGSSTDRTLINGIDAQLFSASNTGGVTVNGAGGSIWSAGDAINVGNAGTGATTVNYTGVINTSAGDGIQAVAMSGVLNVSTGVITALGGAGVNTTTTTGSQTITLGGNVTSNQIGVDGNSTSGSIAVNVNGGSLTATGAGIDLSTGGAATVTVAAGRAVTGDIGILSSGSTLLVNNNGTITGTGVGGDAIFTGGATATTINNNAGAIINGDFDLSNLADTVNNSGTYNSIAGSRFLNGNDLLANLAGGVINLDGTIDFGTGTDTFTNAGTVNTTLPSTLVGLETLTNTGTFNANVGLTFDGGATALTNTGTINSAGTIDFGAGADSFANNGTGIFDLTANTTLTGLETFTQAGRINLFAF